MPRDERKYSRLYHEAMDDPKFETVWDNDQALALWVRLLVAADMAWPAPASLPRSVKVRVLDILVSAGLVDRVRTDYYRIHGMTSERKGRSDAAAHAAQSRWDATRNADRIATRTANRNAETMPSREETSRDETRRAIARDGLPNLDAATIAALEERTGRVASQAGDRQLNEYDRLVGDHGLAPVLAAFDAIRDGKTMTARQLIWPALRLLEPFPTAPKPVVPDKPFVPRKLEPWEQEYRDAIQAGYDRIEAGVALRPEGAEHE